MATKGLAGTIKLQQHEKTYTCFIVYSMHYANTGTKANRAMVLCR